MYLPKLDLEQLYDRAAVEAWVEKLSVYLSDYVSSSSAWYGCTVVEDREHSQFNPEVIFTQHGIDIKYRFDQDFFRSRDYQSIASLGEELQQLLEESAYLQRGERQYQLRNLGDGIQWLLDISRKGNNIQRYKGLGEMNPDQLWETTMDPDARRMLQVTIDDAIGADQLFSTLMGDDVEPRRAFIESNALNVSNLDV
jgi:DNA gyrase subunit B